MALWSALLSRRASTPLPARPSRTLFFLLAGTFLLTLVPHVLQFPLWLTLTVVTAIVLRALLEIYRLPLPSPTICGLVAIVLLGLILWWFDTLLGRDAGTAFTAGLLAIKFYELRRPRDVSLIIFSCFFMVMSALLYSQVLELFVYCLIMMWVLTALLLRVHTGDLPEDRLLRMLRRSGIVFLQALPFALFLFFFFPRYTGKLSITLDGSSVGLTDNVAPGSIAKLADDDSEAMYVRFTSPNVPTTDTMYWRALVLWDYWKGVWTPGPLSYLEPIRKSVASPGSNLITQEITIRPHHQRWLFALDAPISTPVNEAELPSGAAIFVGNVLQLTRGARLDNTARYTVTSANFLDEEELRKGEREGAVHLPLDQIDPSVKALADQLHQGLSDAQVPEYIRAVLHFFRHGGFTYSTAPGAQGPDWLPIFLFKSKIGFCEHFASAFAVLMRLEHVPARLVVGYQGADYNPYADNYIVSQSNAHAWDEVWLEGRKHWVRIDPTALLASSEDGPAPANAADTGDTLSMQVAHHHSSFAETYLPTWMKSAMKDMQLRREQIETSWDNLVLSYDPETQNRLAKAFGFGDKAQIGLLFICFVAAGICLIIFQKWMARKPVVSPIENLYALFCRNMARRGIPRAVWEGPFAYTERVAEAFPDERQVIQRVGSIVAQARYGPSPADATAPHQLQSLLTLVTASQAAAISRERR